MACCFTRRGCIMAYTGAIVGKSIHAKKPKIDLFRFHMLRALNAVAVGMKKDFETTTETFEERPIFEIHLSTTGGLLLAEVSTDDENYTRLDEGTPEHIIVARNAPNLVYEKGYTSKTIPRVLKSRQSSYAGPTRRRKTVIHPGFKAREFSGTIMRKWEPRVKTKLEEAIRNAVREAGM